MQQIRESSGLEALEPFPKRSGSEKFLLLNNSSHFIALAAPYLSNYQNLRYQIHLAV